MVEKCECPTEAGAATCELAQTRPAVSCPTCERAGKAVDTATVKALLALSLTEVRAVEYRLCRTPDCPTVYYSVAGEQQFREDDLRERVYQKHLNDEDVFVCYCFRHTPLSIRKEMVLTGSSTVIEAIIAGIQAGQCACDIRNPQGSCCLGNVRAAVQRVEAQSR